mmetsp:Transcript_28245/g.83448  ORF Transcript_28245/g.83448 Transcript_28245/m.83448 type:complete len:218 (+) Transcript_28245:390-1043(+)
MSTALPLVLHRPHDCVVNLELVRKVQLLKREREGRVGAAHARDRCLEVVKARVLDGGGNLGAKAGGEWRLVRHQQPARLLDRVADRVHVPRRNRLQVDDLARHALCRRPLARARHRVHLPAQQAWPSSEDGGACLAVLLRPTHAAHARRSISATARPQPGCSGCSPGCSPGCRPGCSSATARLPRLQLGYSAACAPHATQVMCSPGERTSASPSGSM